MSELERTDVSNQFYQGLIQGILGQENPTDPIAREDAVWYRLNELTDENAISPDEAVGAFEHFIKQERPDVTIIRLGQAAISNPFYE